MACVPPLPSVCHPLADQYVITQDRPTHPIVHTEPHIPLEGSYDTQETNTPSALQCTAVYCSAPIGRRTREPEKGALNVHSTHITLWRPKATRPTEGPEYPQETQRRSTRPTRDAPPLPPSSPHHKAAMGITITKVPAFGSPYVIICTNITNAEC